MADRPIPTDPAAIVAELVVLAGVIAAADDARERRLKLWLAARTGDTKVTFAKLAQASDVAEPYVIRMVGKSKPAVPKVARPRSNATAAPT